MQHIWKSAVQPGSGASALKPVNQQSAKLPKMHQANLRVQKNIKIRKVMASVLLALLPAVIGSVYFFGPYVLPYYAISILAALFADFTAQLVRRKQIDSFDLSAVVTGTLLAMSLPLGAPLWVPALGSMVGIWFAKELFGGIGKNFLNPALLGRAALQLLFPAVMMQNPVPTPLFGISAAPDMVAGATVLTLLKEGRAVDGGQLINSFLGLVPGKIGETSALLLLIGGVWLAGRGILRLRIPLAFLSSVAVMAFVFGGTGGLFTGSWQMVRGNLLGGATALGAFFIAAAYGCSPVAPVTQYVYGALCGVLTMLFRLYGPWSGGLTFAILIANFAVPLLKRVEYPRVAEPTGSVVKI